MVESSPVDQSTLNSLRIKSAKQHLDLLRQSLEKKHPNAGGIPCILGIPLTNDEFGKDDLLVLIAHLMEQQEQERQEAESSIRFISAIAKRSV